MKHCVLTSTQQTTHNHKSKITSKDLQSIGMMNSIRQWYKDNSTVTLTYQTAFTAFRQEFNKITQHAVDTRQ